jgi:hypothetical protein
MFAPRLVPTAELPPFRCLLSGLNDGPFVDASVQIESVPMQSPRAYFHPTAIEQLAREIGMVTGKEHAKTAEALARAHARVEELEAVVEDQQAQLDASAALVNAKTGDWVIRKPQGRKPKEKEAVNG